MAVRRGSPRPAPTSQRRSKASGNGPPLLRVRLHAARDPAFARRFRKVRQAGLRELRGGLSNGLEHAGIEPTVPSNQLARGLRALSYGLALDRLMGDGRGSEVLFGRVTELIFRGLAAESKSSQPPRRAKG